MSRWATTTFYPSTTTRCSSWTCAAMTVSSVLGSRLTCSSTLSYKNSCSSGGRATPSSTDSMRKPPIPCWDQKLRWKSGRVSTKCAIKSQSVLSVTIYRSYFRIQNCNYMEASVWFRTSKPLWRSASGFGMRSVFFKFYCNKGTTFVGFGKSRTFSRSERFSNCWSFWLFLRKVRKVVYLEKA